MRAFSKYISFILISIIFVLLYFFVNTVLTSVSKSNTVTLDNWQYYEGTAKPDTTDWIQLKSLKEISKVNKGNVFWLRTDLPECNIASPALYIGQVNNFIQVFLNNKLVYQLGDSLSIKHGKIIGWNQNLVELPFFKKGDVLTLKIGTQKESVNVLEKILLGSSGIIIRNVFRDSFGSLFFSLLFLIIGLIIFITCLSIFKTKLLIGIAAFITSIAVLFACNSLILQLLFPALSLYYHLDYISIMSSTTSGFFAIEQIIGKKYKWILKSIWQTHFAFLFISILLINFTDITYLQILPYFLIFLALSMLLCFVAMVLSAKSGNYESKLLFIGMTSFFLFAVIEIILYFTEGLFSEFGFSIKVLHIGVLCFVISLIWIVIRDYLNTNKQKELARQKQLDAVKRENEARQQYAMKLIESQEVERNRIALELHDSIGQKLLLINNKLLTKIRKESEPTAVESLKEISNLTGETIQEIRDISWNLRPQHLDQLGLTTAIETLVEKVEESSGVKFHSQIDNIDNFIPKENEINLYRIIQESLNNIVKHSRATEAFIKIERNGKMVYMEIKDNGIGANQPVKSAGFGLTGMYERAEMLGAKLNIILSETSGTVISMEYQLK